MTNLPFETYTEATEYFGINIPRQFFNSLLIIDKFSRERGIDPLVILFDVFGLLRIEGEEARYQQTPVEFFPFGSIGSDGIHYGFIVHVTDEDDYPSGEICPMDSDGVVAISKDSKTLFQNLIWDNALSNEYLPLLRELNLEPIIVDRKRYDQSGNVIRVDLKPRDGWKYIQTSDGSGVFADESYFADYHERKYNRLYGNNTIEIYESLAYDMLNNGLYGSQLYYLKQLYWNEWTDYALAKKYLKEMLVPYEKLNREHLYNMTKKIIAKFDKRFSP